MKLESSGVTISRRRCPAARRRRSTRARSSSRLRWAASIFRPSATARASRSTWFSSTSIPSAAASASRASSSRTRLAADFAAFGAESGHGLPAHLDVAVERKPERCKPVLEVSQLALDLALDHRFGNVDPHVIAQRLESGTLVMFAVLFGSFDRERGAVVLAHVLQGGTVLIQHREGVVLGRQVALAHRVHGDVDGHGRAAELLLAVVLGQGGLEGARLPCGEADDTVDDRRDHQLPVQLELALLAILPGEHLIAAAHHQRTADHVTGLGGAVDVDELRVPAPRLLDRLVDVLLGDLGGLHRNSKVQVIAQVNLRLHGHGRRELEWLVALQLAEIELRVADGLDASLVDGTTVELGDEVVDGLVPDGLPADGTLNHR